MALGTGGTLECFRQLITGIYEMMKDVDFVVLDVRVTLWQLFLWGLVGGLIVWALKKFFDM